MEKTVITFNDLPEIVAQLRDEVMSLRSLLTEQRSVNNARAVDTHVPMSVEEAAEYLGIPKGTLYMKLSEGKHSRHQARQTILPLQGRTGQMAGILPEESRTPVR